MIKLKKINKKLLLAKCLLAVFLFFSFILIAGYNGNSNSILKQTGQTELVYPDKNPTVSKTVFYSGSLPQRNQTVFYSHHNNLFLLLIYNKITKVKLDSRSKKVYSISILKRFFLINNILQNSDEEDFTSFLS